MGHSRVAMCMTMPSMRLPGPLFTRSRTRKRGGLGRPPSRTARSAVKRAGATSGRADRSALVACGDLVEGRVRHLVRLNLRCSLNHLRQARQHLRIDVAAIVVRALFPITQTDRHRFGAVRGDEGNLVLEALLFPKQGQDVLLERLGKLTGRVGLQMQGHIACVHVRLLSSSDVNLRDYQAFLCVLCLLVVAQYIPPMPPPPGIGGIFSFSFFSATTHSVVRSSPAMDAAFCSAVRVTLVGSMTPAATRSSYSSVWAL